MRTRDNLFLDLFVVKILGCHQYQPYHHGRLLLTRSDEISENRTLHQRVICSRLSASQSRRYIISTPSELALEPRPPQPHSSRTCKMCHQNIQVFKCGHTTSPEVVKCNTPSTDCKAVFLREELENVKGLCEVCSSELELELG